MDLEHMQNKNMNLVLSKDAKPRLKWTPELHQRFLEAVDQLGGAEKATPKSLMRVMGMPGLTLYHLKSHLQKYRLGKGQKYEDCINKKQEDDLDASYSENKDHTFSRESCNENKNHKSPHLAKALQLQMEVQRKLHQQIEVQRRLQLRIEAQGKYLQTVLKRAQESLSGHTCSSSGVNPGRKELPKLFSGINNEFPSPSFSGLTEAGTPYLTDSGEKQRISILCSMESSLTSLDSSARMKEKQPQDRMCNSISNPTIKLPLVDINLEKEPCNAIRKQSSECDFIELSPGEGSSCHTGKNRLRIHKAAQMLDLNSQCQDDIDL